MRIGELANFFGVSPKALRIYEKKGILRPAKIDAQTGYRYYSADQVKQLNALLALKELGFSLSRIKALMEGGMERDGFMEALAHQRMRWQDAISYAENKIDEIDQITERLAASSSAAKLHEMTEDERAWLLVKLVCVENVQNILSEAIWL